MVGRGWSIGCALSLLGCGASLGAQVKSRFAATVQCSDVDVVALGHGRYQASGCDKTSTYDCDVTGCEPEGDVRSLLREHKTQPTEATRQLWINIKLEFGVLTLMAEPEVRDTVTLSVLSAGRGCDVVVLIDGERVNAKGGKRDELTLTRPTARALGLAQRVVLKACDARWVLDDRDLAKVRAFVLRFEEDLALRDDPEDGVVDGKLPPRGGWQPWSGLTAQPATAKEGAPLEATSLFQKLAPSVLRIETQLQLGQAQGSGVAVSATRLITNCHVLEGALKITARQGNQSYSARLINSDPAGDRCVLELVGSSLTPIAGVRPFAELQVGEPLYTLGAPSGLDLSLANGILSAVRDIEGSQYVQTTAPISPGSSGGGLFDARGNLVGITTMALVGRERLNQSLNFAIPAESFWRP